MALTLWRNRNSTKFSNKYFGYVLKIFNNPVEQLIDERDSRHLMIFESDSIIDLSAYQLRRTCCNFGIYSYDV